MSIGPTYAAEREQPHGPIRFGPFELDTDRFELRRAGTPVSVEPRTFDLLTLLARNIGRTVTRDQIFDGVWQGRIVSDAALSSQIKAARQVLGDNGTEQRMIATVHGRGFRLRQAPPPEAPAPATGRDAFSRGSPTVAVLPCISLDQDGRGTIMARGLTEDITTALSKNRWLRVIPPASVAGISSDRTDIATNAEKLGADYLVTGSVRRAGSRVRATVRTLDAVDLRCIWNESFDRDMTDIFELQEQISHLVASRIATELGITEQNKALHRPRKNLGAWELYHLGSAEFLKFTAESNRRCQRLMRQAIRQDPGFCYPHARLAYAIVLEMVYFDGPIDRARMDEALDLAMTAVACDEQDASAFFSLGRVRLVRREYELAIDALEQAIRLNPCLALAYCGLGDSLAYEGRLDEALVQFRTAIELSPHDPFRWAFMSYRSMAHLFGHQFEEAVFWARRATQMPHSHYWARANLVAALGHAGDRRQRAEASGALLKCRPDFSCRFAEDRLFYIKSRSQIGTFVDGLKQAGIR